ncbi:MAG: UvrD-helicase domain-containing protein [Iamia sp.]
MPDADLPADQAARDRIGHDLTPTLFVEAGAGSGKTTALVDRVCVLVTEPSGPAGAPVPLGAVAAITFTEKAGAELRERLRRTLEETAEDAEGDRGAAARAALTELDGAAIGTLHAFAQRLLSEHPIEAGLPPRVEVLDEVSSGVEFERRWARFSDELFEASDHERTLLLLFAAGAKPATPHALARTFDSNWDLVAERVPDDSPPPPPVRQLAAPALGAVEAACRYRVGCTDPADRLCLFLDDAAEWLAHVRGIDDELQLLDALADPRHPGGDRVGFKPGTKGSMAAWGSKDNKAEAAEALREAGAAIDGVTATVATSCAHHLGAALRRFTLTSAEERRREGALEFHDLLVLARSLLRDPDHGARVRSALHDRYQRLLLDEFQDTDPIQIELAVRIAATDPGSDAAGAGEWSDVEVAPGRLFVVGDPKQSIYRFRRADISLFLQAARRFSGPAGEGLTLSTNFRTVGGVIDWVNATFGRLLEEAPVHDLLVESQPRYTPLASVRPDPPTGPAVSVLGRAAHPYRTKAAEIRTAEAHEVVDTIQRAMAECWQVDDRAKGWRDAALGDITILVPARTSLPYLEDALSDAGIPYRAEASSLVYATRAIRDLLMVLRAVADPTDELRIVSALRTPLFGCGDDDLHRFRVERGGHWSYLGRQPDGVPGDDPVAEGLATLRGWHDLRHWASPSVLLERIVADRRAMELAFVEGRPRDVWRRIRFVVDQARAWSGATGGDLRDYLDWVGLQTVEGARVAEAILPETDDDAVRIMTIHAAKGLEFPVTIVSGLSTSPRHGPRPGDARFPPEGGVAYYLGKNAETPEFTATRPVDEQMSHDERLRLLYVATTRARDHLVISLHRAERRTPPSPTTRSSAEVLVEGMGPDLLAALPDAADGTLAAAPTPAARPVEPPEPFEAWAEAHATALAAAHRPTTVAATALTDEGRPDVEPPDEPPPAVDRAPAEGEDARGQLLLDFTAARPDPELDRAPDGADAGLRKRAGDLDRPPWLKGRYGTAVGRAVHGVLQTIPLDADPSDAPVLESVAAQCQAEAIPDREDTVHTLVAQALESRSVTEASAAEHWREIYACTPVGERLLEGYVDLLYRSPDGLVVVDYKTAATADADDLDRRVDGYRTQGASYALIVGRATGEAVARVTFCFLTPQGVVERHLDDVPAAVAEVEAAVLAGTAVALD